MTSKCSSCGERKRPSKLNMFPMVNEHVCDDCLTEAKTKEISSVAEAHNFIEGKRNG